MTYPSCAVELLTVIFVREVFMETKNKTEVKFM